MVRKFWVTSHFGNTAWWVQVLLQDSYVVSAIATLHVPTLSGQDTRHMPHCMTAVM